MKKIITTIVIMLVTVVTVNAMPYQQAREQALFLTDKMAYELNLNQQQYEAAYEINLDYLMDVTTVDDVYAASWRQRNIDLQYILQDWQYNAFCAASYFFRPLYWNAGNWHFGVYAHYPHHDFFYFGRPACFASYRGAHSWRYNGGRSWYMIRRDNFYRPGVAHTGLRDSYRPAPRKPVPERNDRYNNRNDYRTPNHSNGYNRPGYNGRNDNTTRPDYPRYGRDNNNGYNRESSTRRTVTNGNATPNHNGRNNPGNGYRPNTGTVPSQRDMTRSAGNTFRGNSGTRTQQNGSSGIQRR